MLVWVSVVRFPNPLAFGLPKVRRGPCLGLPKTYFHVFLLTFTLLTFFTNMDYYYFINIDSVGKEPHEDSEAYLLRIRCVVSLLTTNGISPDNIDDLPR